MSKFTKDQEQSLKPNYKKNRRFYEINLKQKINKSKELRKTLKSMGLPSKAA